jgi:hypothetical protein
MRILLNGLVLGAVCVSFAGCKVNKTQEGKLPKVEVKTTEGQLPAYNIQGPNVEVGSKTETIKVPTVHVTTPDQKNHPSQ